MITKTALITGIAGQDGCLLAELLLGKGYAVCGTVRHLSLDDLSRISHLRDRVQLIAGDLLDQHSLALMLEDAQPDEVYILVVGDPLKIHAALGWTPRTSFPELVRLMVQADMRCHRGNAV